MLNASQQTATFSFGPLTPDEVDLLGTITAISFTVGVLAFLCILAAASVVAIKTQLPGRYSVLLSLLLLPAWWGFEQFMGGSLEMTFGPEALLVTAIIYSVIAVLFASGYLRMCMKFLKQRTVTGTQRDEAFRTRGLSVMVFSSFGHAVVRALAEFSTAFSLANGLSSSMLSSRSHRRRPTEN
jgi:hypothetical protein